MCLHMFLSVSQSASLRQTPSARPIKEISLIVAYTLWDIYDIPGSAVSILHPFSHLFHKMILQDGYN